MTEELVSVPKSLLKILQQHCLYCPGFAEQRDVLLPDLSDEPASKKRNTPPESWTPVSSGLLQISGGPQQSPPLEPARSFSRASKRAKPPEENSITNIFLKGVPLPTEWRKRQMELGLCTVTQYEKVIQAFTGCIQASVIKEPSQENGLVAIAMKLADFSLDGKRLSAALATDPLFENKSLLKALSNFQSLLLLSFCAVLETRKIPHETLDIIAKRVTSIAESDRRRLRTHAVRINRVINELMECGWNIYQATELFFINALSPSTLIRICSDKDNIKFILTLLKTKGLESYGFSDCLRPEYSIPGLITYLISKSDIASDRNQISIHDICTTLGYNPDKVPKSGRQICVHPPNITVEFHVTGIDSFRNGPPQVQEKSYVRNRCIQPLPIPRESLLHDTVRFDNGGCDSAMQDSLSQIAHSSDRHLKDLFKTEPTAVCLLLLLRFVAGSIKLDTQLLSYAGSARTRWATSGELETFKVGDVGLDHVISELLIDTKEVERNLDLLNSLALISSESWNVPCSIWLKDHLCSQIDLLIDSPVQMYWRKQALILTSYLFMGNGYTKLFANIGRLALPHFQRAIPAFMESSDRNYLTTHLRNVLVEALIGSSKFSDMTWKIEALEKIKDLEGEGLETDVQARIIQRESFLLRTMGKLDESSKVIQDYWLNHNDPPENPELNAIRGLLVTSMAENFYENGEFALAHETLHKWKVSGVSRHEMGVSRKGMVLNGRIHLNEGNYQLAKEFLEAALQTYDLLDQGRHDVVSYLGDVYCELEEPRKALNLVSEIQVAQARVHLHLRRCRNLVISFAEASVCAARYEEAETILQELKRYFDEISIIERMDQQRHLRTLILYAQNLHRRSVKSFQWAETLERWYTVADISEKYVVIATTGMDYAVILLSQSHIMHELGQHGESQKLFHSAVNRLRVGGLFWRRGMGTYWLNFVWSKLSHLEGSNMLCLARQGPRVCLQDTISTVL